MAFKIDNAVLAAYLSSLGVTDMQPGTTRLIGIKGATPSGQNFADDKISLTPMNLQRDHWGDTVGFWGGSFGLFKATVSPGQFWTENAENPNGAAHVLTLEEGGNRTAHDARLKPPAPYRFTWGTHHGKYPCLVQAEAFTVGRDRNRDGVWDASEPFDRGQFGIHIHWGGKLANVGAWSAGCQVLFGGGDPMSPWEQFKGVLKATGQTEFSYYPVDGWALARHLGLLK